MPETILEAIRRGLWNFEPEEVECEAYDACRSLPGSADKLLALADRVRRGLPLWHPADRLNYEDSP